jgi:hypothetical protein
MIIVPVVVLAFVLGLVGVDVFAGNSTVTSPSGTATSSAGRQLLRSALAAANRVNSFHYLSNSSLTGSGGGTQKVIGDAGPDSGKQVITAGDQKFTVLVVGQACYIRGNAAALVVNLGLTSALAAAHANQWISLARTDGPYASVYAAVTAHSALSDNISVVPRDQSTPTRRDGRLVQTVTGAIAPVPGQTGTPKGTATLTVRASTPHLPVRYTEQGTLSGQTSVSTLSFSRWGEALHITAPTGAVAFASIGAGSGTTPTTPSGTVLT